jgi:sporulation protein YqfC
VNKKLNCGVAEMKTSKPRRSMPALDWLCDLSGRTARITSLGNRSLLVENHRGILDFTSDRIVLSTACGDAEIAGCDLSLQDVRRDALIIHGNIRDVKLPQSEADEHES